MLLLIITLLARVVKNVPSSAQKKLPLPKAFPTAGTFYTNSQLKCLTERIRFFVLTKPSEVRRTGGTLNGTRQSQSEKDGARIKPF